MKDLSMIQQYMICMLGEKGKISGSCVEKSVCFVAAGLLEMQLENCISIDGKKISVTANLPESKSYLKPLYDRINQSKAVTVNKIMEEYNYSITDKRFYELMVSVGSSLKDMELVEEVKVGLFGNKKGYIPAKSTVHLIIDMVRSELLEDAEITEDIAGLVILLEKSKCLKSYFSEFERKEMKQKIEQVSKTPNGRMVKEMIEYILNMIAIFSGVSTVFDFV